MASWLDAVLSPLNAATDTIKGAIDIRDQVKFGESVSQLYAQLLAAYRGAIDAQLHEAAMLQENRHLKERVTQLDDWNTQKQRYKLKEFPPGVFLYSLKAEVAGDDPPYKACPNCYRRGMIRILQNRGTAMGIDHLHCHECNSGFEIGIRQKPNVDRSGGRRGSWMGS